MSPISLNRPLALIGFPCSGKTSVGQLLAQALALPWLDSDQLIAAATGQTPADWLKTQGEPAFREIERDWLRAWTPQGPCVLSTGGGLPCYRDNLQLLAAKALTVYLDLGFETLSQRLLTPPGHALTRIYAADGLKVLHHKRERIYRQAELKVSADGTPEQIAERILAVMAEQMDA
ncbi:MAG: shikimate kinase [Candidatus Sericytochromatia bacterium]